jgi:hypothetical protein
MPKVKYNDYPFPEIAKSCREMLDRGLTFHQKFTCDGCGARQTIETPDTLFTKGICEECGHVTDIEKRGCNYLLSGPVDEVLKVIHQEEK